MSYEARSQGHGRQKKLTDEQVQEIRAIYAAGGVTTRALGKEYGVSHNLIFMIVTGKQRRGA